MIEQVLDGLNQLIVVYLDVAALAVVELVLALEPARRAQLEARALAAVPGALLGLPALVVGVDGALDDGRDALGDRARPRGPGVARLLRRRLLRLAALRRGRLLLLNRLCDESSQRGNLRRQLRHLLVLGGRHGGCGGADGGGWRDGWLILSNQSDKMVPLIQIFFYFERYSKFAEAGAQRFTLHFTS